MHALSLVIWASEPVPQPGKGTCRTSANPASSKGAEKNTHTMLFKANLNTHKFALDTRIKGKDKGSWICVAPHCEKLASEALRYKHACGQGRTLYRALFQDPASSLALDIAAIVAYTWRRQGQSSCVHDNVDFCVYVTNLSLKTVLRLVAARNKLEASTSHFHDSHRRSATFVTYAQIHRRSNSHWGGGSWGPDPQP